MRSILLCLLGLELVKIKIYLYKRAGFSVPVNNSITKNDFTLVRGINKVRNKYLKIS